VVRPPVAINAFRILLSRCGACSDEFQAIANMRAHHDRRRLLLAGELLFGASIVLTISANAVGLDSTTGGLLGLLVVITTGASLAATSLSAPSAWLRGLALAGLVFLLVLVVGVLLAR
jgi:hypothetical protein